uniref:Uncharacterized protein n=1 Tax=Gouania willdenowi TaxID=441366 RepID=A0A8C5DMV5_GOUWI
HGPFAFSIGTTNDGQAFLAGSYFGKGRVIVTTHELFFQNEVPFELSISLHYQINDLSVFVCEAYSSTHVKEIQEFVAEGGGLLIGGHAWAPDPDALLPYLIKDIPLMPLVHNQRIQINANTASERKSFD